MANIEIFLSKWPYLMPLIVALACKVYVFHDYWQNRKIMSLGATVMLIAAMSISLNNFLVYYFSVGDPNSVWVIKSYHASVALLVGAAPLVSSERSSNRLLRRISVFFFFLFLPIQYAIFFTNLIVFDVHAINHHISRVDGVAYHYIFTAYMFWCMSWSVIVEISTRVDMERDSKNLIKYRDFSQYVQEHQKFKVGKVFERIAWIVLVITIMAIIFNYFQFKFHVPWLVAVGSTFLLGASVYYNDNNAICAFSQMLRVRPDHEYSININNCKKRIRQLALEKDVDNIDITVKNIVEEMRTYTILYLIQEYPNTNWVAKVSGYSHVTIQKELKKLTALGYGDLIPSTNRYTHAVQHTVTS